MFSDRADGDAAVVHHGNRRRDRLVEGRINGLEELSLDRNLRDGAKPLGTRPRGPGRRPGPRRPDRRAPHAGDTRGLAGQEKPGRPRHEDRLPDRWSRLEPSPARGLGGLAAPGVPRCRAALASGTDQGAARQAEDPPPPPHAVLRGNRCHPERRQRDDVHLLRPSRPHAETGLDAPGVRPMLESRTTEPRAGECEPRADRGDGRGSCAATRCGIHCPRREYTIPCIASISSWPATRAVWAGLYGWSR